MCIRSSSLKSQVRRAGNEEVGNTNYKIPAQVVGVGEKLLNVVARK